MKLTLIVKRERLYQNVHESSIKYAKMIKIIKTNQRYALTGLL